MNSFIKVLLFIATGSLLGGIYFGGLYVTLTKLPHIRFKTLFGIGSFVLRTAFVSAVLSATIIHSSLYGVCFMLVGFTISKLALVHLIRPDRNIEKNV